MLLYPSIVDFLVTCAHRHGLNQFSGGLEFDFSTNFSSRKVAVAAVFHAMAENVIYFSVRSKQLSRIPPPFCPLFVVLLCLCWLDMSTLHRLARLAVTNGSHNNGAQASATPPEESTLRACINRIRSVEQLDDKELLGLDCLILASIESCREYFS